MNVRLFALVAVALAGCTVADEASSDAQSLAVEQAALPQLFTLLTTEVTGGQPATFGIQGGPPNSSVRLARAVGGAAAPGPCPPPLAGGCLDINGPQGIDLFPFSITTNANGNGSITVNVPAGVPDGVPVAFQAVHPASGTGSNPVEIVTGPPPATCGTDTFEPNDDAFAAVAGAAPNVSSVISLGTDFDWYAFTATAGQTIQVDAFFTHISGAVDIDTYLTAAPYDNTNTATGARGTGNYLQRGFGSVDNESFTVVAPSTGTYYVMVHNFITGSTTCSDYDLVVSVF